MAPRPGWREVLPVCCIGLRPRSAMTQSRRRCKRPSNWTVSTRSRGSPLSTSWSRVLPHLKASARHHEQSCKRGRALDHFAADGSCFDLSTFVGISFKPLRTALGERILTIRAPCGSRRLARIPCHSLQWRLLFFSGVCFEYHDFCRFV